MTTSTRAATDRIRQFLQVRETTERLAARLTPEDQQLQSMPNCSPTKWHRAHTTWFFEQFLLLPHLAGYRVFDERFAYLFNSYYVAAGPRHARPKRGLLTRPDCGEISAFRAHVDEGVEQLIAAAADAQGRALRGGRADAFDEGGEIGVHGRDVTGRGRKSPPQPP